MGIRSFKNPYKRQKTRVLKKIPPLNPACGIGEAIGARGHSRQLKKSEEGITWLINKGKRIKIMRCSLVNKVSPPFEGGVAGTTYYLTFTRVISRPGWLIYSLLFNLIFMNNKILLNRIDLKSFRSSLSNRSSSAEAALWEVIKSRKIDGRKHNQPPRPQQTFAIH